VQRFDGSAGPISDVALSPDNRLVITVSEDGSTRLWDARSGAENQSFIKHDGAVRSAAFSPDNRFLVTGGDDNAALLWSIETGALVRRYIGHTLPVTVVGFSPDGQQVITGSRDKVVRLWDVEAGGGLLRHIVGHRQRLLSISMSARGDLLVTSDIGYAYIWRADLSGVVALACQIIPNDLTAEERRRYNIADDDKVCA
jgi:WD40 repeat protein